MCTTKIGSPMAAFPSSLPHCLEVPDWSFYPGVCGKLLQGYSANAELLRGAWEKVRVLSSAR